MDLSRYKEVIAYSRFSSPRQASGTSEERQEEAQQSFAAQHGITLSTRRVDRGRSGFHGKHLEEGGALRLLIDDLAEGRIATPALLVIERQDRFGRQPAAATIQAVLNDLFDNDCDLYHLNQNRLYTRDIVDAEFGALVTLAADIYAAHSYSAVLSDRSKKAHSYARARMKQGDVVRPGWAPRWVDQVGDGWILNDYAATVLRVAELLESGMGQIATAKALMAEGRLLPRGGTSWTPGSVSHLIYSPAIAGGREVKRRSGDIVWDYFPPVIGRGRWEAILQKMKGRAQGKSGPQDQIKWIGQTVTVCTCGRAVGFRACSYKGKEGRLVVSYVRCRGRIGGHCDQPALRLEPLQASLLTRLQGSQLQRLVGGAADGQQQQLEEEVTRLNHDLLEARAVARAAEEQMETVLKDEPAAAAVLARQIARSEARAAEVEKQLVAAQHRLEAARKEERCRAAAELDERVRGLLRTFARGEDTPEQRREVNSLLRRLDLRLTVDASAERLALQIGDGEPQWQPIHTTLAADQLEAGRAGVQYASLFVSKADIIEAARKAKESGTDEVELPFSITDGDLTIPGQIVGE